LPWVQISTREPTGCPTRSFLFAAHRALAREAVHSLDPAATYCTITALPHPLAPQHLTPQHARMPEAHAT
jgi:hypothetical protein